MLDSEQSSALTPSPSPATAGEGRDLTETVIEHFRRVKV
ncbi:MAG: hypothetical protein V7642_2895 [Burkholderiales bacterium]|jgi:hypothetical protein